MSDVKTKRSALVFGAMRQNVAAEHMARAELEIADNVEMDEEGTWIKRPGFDRVTPTRDSGSWTTGGKGMAWDDTAMAVIDGGERCWSFDGTYRNRGPYPRGYNKSIIRAPIDRAIRTTVLSVSTNTWVITQTTTGYVTEIFNTSTGARVVAPFFNAVSGIDALAAVTDGGTFVWVLSTTDGTDILADRITIATPTVAAVQTTYLSTAGATWQSIDAFFLTSPNEIAVVASGINGTNAKYVHSFLDQGTGAARTSPAAVIVSNATTADFVTPAGTDDIQNSISVLNSPGTTIFYYTVWDQNVLKIVEVNSTTLVAAATTSLVTETTTSTTKFRGVASGYVDPSSLNWVVFSASGRIATAITQPVLTRFTKNGGSFTNDSFSRALWPASRPAAFINTQILAVQYEKFGSTEVAATTQRTLYAMTNDGHILARVSPGQLRANTTNDEVWPTLSHAFADSITTNWVTGALVDLTPNVTKIDQLNRAYGPAWVRINMILTYGRPVKYAFGKCCIPGGIPGMFGASERARSLTPLMAPVGITAALGSGAALSGATGTAVVYRFVDSDGTITRSAPALKTFTFTDAGTRSVTVDTLRVGHASLTDNAVFGDPLASGASSTVQVEIELYLTRIGESDLILHSVVPNTPATETVTITVLPSSPDFLSAELLYTTGGRLSAAVAPQTRCAAFWRDRLHLASDDFVFSSGEAQFGFGPEFSEFKRRRFVGADIVAISPIDWNYLAAIKESGAAALSGPGPDNRGSGNYELQVLNTEKGTDNPRNVVQSLYGAHFQDSQDGQQCLITSALQVVGPGDGVFDRHESAVKDCAHVEALRQVWFILSDRILVLDYEHVTEDQPFGRWAEWKGSGLTGAVGEMIAVDPILGPAIVISNASGIVRRRKLGGVYTDDTATSPAGYEQLLQTGEFPFAGFGGEYNIQELWALLENVSGGTLSVELTLSSDRAEKVAGPETFSLTTTRRRVAWRPGGQSRVGGTKIKISDASSLTAGYRLVAVILEIAGELHGKFPRTADRS